MSLKNRITDDMKLAMKSKDSERLGTIRLLLAAIKEREIAQRQAGERVELEDSGVLAVIEKMIKQRRDSIEQFEKANRPELAAKEQTEITVITAYLPSPLSADEIAQLIQHSITDTAATSIKDMGKVMADLKPKIQGRADISSVSAKIKELLGE